MQIHMLKSQGITSLYNRGTHVTAHPERCWEALGGSGWCTHPRESGADAFLACHRDAALGKVIYRREGYQPRSCLFGFTVPLKDLLWFIALSRGSVSPCLGYEAAFSSGQTVTKLLHGWGERGTKTNQKMPLVHKTDFFSKAVNFLLTVSKQGLLFFLH